MSKQVTFDYLDGLHEIEPFKTEVEEMRSKYGMPLIYMWNPHSNCGGRAGASNEFYAEFLKLKERIVAWLKKEFPVEVSNDKIFRDDGRNIAFPFGMDFNAHYYKGLDAWLGAQTRPSPHYGNPGAQWAYETSNGGCMSSMVNALLQAYRLCKSEAEKRKAKMEEEALRRKKAVEAEALYYKKLEEAAKAAKLRKQAEYVEKLIQYAAYQALLRKKEDEEVERIEYGTEFKFLPC